MRVVFCGSGYFAVPSFRAIVGGGHELVGVLTQPARQAGRGGKLRATPIAVAAAELSVDVTPCENINSDEMISLLKALAPDVIAVVERFIRTLKDECTRRILVPFRREAFRTELRLFVEWYNEYRPHTYLDGRTPNELALDLPPANEAPRLEPRPNWPRNSPCASPQAPVRGDPGARFTLLFAFHGG